MEKVYKPIAIVLLFVLFNILILSIYYTKTISSAFVENDFKLINYNKVPKFHFYAILHNSDEPYFKDIVKGLNETADTCKVALETNFTSSVDDYQDTLRLFNIALAAKVDGIITHAYNTPDFKKLIEEADKKKIPVITIETDLAQSKSASYIGTNEFEIGSSVGKLVAEATKGQAKVAMVLEDIRSYGNVKVEGFRDAVKGYKNIKIETIEVPDLGVVDANNVTQEILTKHPDINVIVCASSKDTIGTAQLIVDLNKVGNIIIIGYDNTPEILRYIQKGVIYATVMPNAYKIGSNAIRGLLDIKENGRTSSYFDVDFDVITKDNLDDFFKNKASEGGATKK